MTKRYPAPDKLLTQTDQATLPTIDQVGDGLGYPMSKISSWRTNDAKNDLPLEEFIDLCRRVVQYCDRISQFGGTAGPSESGISTDQIMAVLRGED